MVKGTENTVERREITIFFKKQTSSVKDMENGASSANIKVI